jgi:hypothetical protein
MFSNSPARQQLLDAEGKFGEGRRMRVVGPVAARRHGNADSLRDFCKVANEAGVPRARCSTHSPFLPSGKDRWNPGQIPFHATDENKSRAHFIKLQQADIIGHFWRRGALLHRPQLGFRSLDGPAKLTERLVDGAVMPGSSMASPNCRYRRLELLSELIDGGSILARRTKFREYRFRLSLSDKLGHTSLLAAMQNNQSALVSESANGSRRGLEFDDFIFLKQSVHVCAPPLKSISTLF